MVTSIGFGATFSLLTIASHAHAFTTPHAGVGVAPSRWCIQQRTGMYMVSTTSSKTSASTSLDRETTVTSVEILDRKRTTPEEVLTTRNDAVASSNTRVKTTIPNANGAAVMDSWQFKILDSMFSFPLFNSILFGIYREQMVKKAEGMGIKWTKFISDLKAKLGDLESIQADITNPAVTIPDYYYAPVHAYADGNLCWDSAMEEDLWSKLMIAPLYDNSVHGDVLMRRDWLDTCKKHIGVDEVKNVIDLGCGTGLSMYMIQSTWNKAKLLGVDLSTFKLAISKDKLLKKTADVQSKVTLSHMPAEATGEPSGKYDLVTICLVNHESPEQVSKDIFVEAFRLLRPGGVFTLLDLDKDNLAILLENPFVAAVYKQTEPYMSEYLKLDMPSALREAGFKLEEIRSSSPSHLAIIARKPDEEPAVVI